MKTPHNGYHLQATQAGDAVDVEKDGAVRVIHVPPLARIHVESELYTPTAKSRWDIAPLRNRTDTARIWTVPGSVAADSLRLYHVDSNGERHMLKRGTDYRIDPVFCGITLAEKWNAENDTFALDYILRLQRVDVLAEKEGELRLFVGAESLVCPRWPRLPAGWLGLARIHLRFCDRLDTTALFPVTRVEHARLVNVLVTTDLAARMPGGNLPDQASAETDTPIWPKVIDYCRHMKGRPEAFARLRRKFRQAKTFHLVYFGDSITQGGDVDPDWRWTTRFTRHLEQAAPDKQLQAFNAAIGGTNSSVGRERFERDVLAHGPDAVTIQFALNDKTMNDETFLANHRYFVSELRKRDVEPILFTSNMNTSVWMDGLDHAEARIVDFCREQDLICLDAYRIWKDLPSYGIPYESLLANGINHPNGVAAGVFFELLKRAFFGSVKSSVKGASGFVGAFSIDEFA